jgi:Transposase
MTGRGVRGQTFGTIMVALERSQVVDLLPTRSAESFGEWFAQHPEVATVSRDRQGVYAEGARRGAPEAVQVADRFHLVLNLTQAVEHELAVNRRHLRIASPSAPALPLSPTAEEVKIQTEQVQVRSSIVLQQNGSCPAAASAETGTVSDDQTNESRWHEGKSNREATWPMPTAHRQMNPARRAAGKKSDVAALGNAPIVPRLFTSVSVGSGLSAWAQAIRGNSEARLQGLLLGTRQIPFAVASAKSRGPKSDLRVPGCDAP